MRPTAAILRKAADLIEPEARSERGFTAKGYWKGEKERSSVLPSCDEADQWSAMGAIWHGLRRYPADAVRAAHDIFKATVSPDRALSIWCLNASREESVAALRQAAELAEAS